MARYFNPGVLGVNGAVYNSTFSLGTTSAGTISVWMRPDFAAGSGATYGIWNFGGTTNDHPGFQRYFNNNIYCGFKDAGYGRIGILDTGLISSGVWANWVFTWQIHATAGQKLYKDTIMIGTPVPFPSALTTTELNYVIGNYAIFGAAFLGAMADFAIWNVTLSSGEIAALAKGVRPGRIRPGALQLWVPCDGIQSPEPDLSGNRSNGTVAQSTLSTGPSISMFTPRWPINDVFPPAAPSFIPAWATQTNLPVLGTGTY